MIGEHLIEKTQPKSHSFCAFQPHHGVSVQSRDHRLDYVICFHCRDIEIYLDGSYWNHGSLRAEWPSFETLLNTTLQEQKVGQAPDYLRDLADRQSEERAALVQKALSDIDRIGIRAMKQGESYQSHKTMDASVKLVVSRFANDPKSLYSLIDLSLSKSTALHCDCTKEMHCSAYRSACISAIHQLRDLKTLEARTTLQNLSKVVGRRDGDVSRVLRDVLNPGSEF